MNGYSVYVKELNKVSYKVFCKHLDMWKRMRQSLVRRMCRLVFRCREIISNISYESKLIEFVENLIRCNLKTKSNITYVYINFSYCFDVPKQAIKYFLTYSLGHPLYIHTRVRLKWFI